MIVYEGSLLSNLSATYWRWRQAKVQRRAPGGGIIPAAVNVGGPKTYRGMIAVAFPVIAKFQPTLNLQTLIIRVFGSKFSRLPSFDAETSLTTFIRLQTKNPVLLK